MLTCCLHSTNIHISAFSGMLQKKTLMCLCFNQGLAHSMEKCCFLAECIWLCCKFALKCMEIKQNQTLLSFCLSVNEQWTLLKLCRQCHTTPVSSHRGLWVCSNIEFGYSCLTCQVLCFKFWWPIAKLWI